MPQGREQQLYQTCMQHGVEFIWPTAGETDQQRKARRDDLQRKCKAARQRQQRSSLSQERQDALRAQNAAAMRQARQRQGSSERAAKRAQNAEAMQRARIRPRVEATRRAGFAQDVMNGIRQVQPIDVGRTAMQCRHCDAVRWQRENAAICCGAGVMQPFSVSPPAIRELGEGNNARGRLFCKNARPLNNTLIWANEDDSAIAWQRQQFPVRVAFPMTIDKVHGQTLNEKKFDEQMFESPLVEGKRKRTLKAPTVFFHIKCHKTRKSLKKKSANKITTHNFVKNRPILPKPSYCAAPPADSSSREPDCVKNCGDKMEGFEILQIKVEDLQSDGFEELAREPERADHVKDRCDKMEEFRMLPIKVEDPQSDGPEDVGRERTQMMGMLAAQYPQVLNSMQDLGSELQELQQEFEQTQHSGRATVDRMEGKRRQLYQFVDEAVDLVKSRAKKRQKEKLTLLGKQMEKLKKYIESLEQEQSTQQKGLHEPEDISSFQVNTDLRKNRLESVSQFQSVKISPFSMLDISQEEDNLDLLIKLNNNILKEIQNGGTPNLDPNSAHPRIIISQDLRTATRTRTKQKYPEHPDRFDVYPQVLSSDSFSSGRHYWEVDVSSSSWCRIGVAFNSMGRKGGGNERLLGWNAESWCLQKYYNQYSAWHKDERILLTLPGVPDRFGFLLDCEAGELTCFGDSRVLHVFKGNFMNPVKPALGVYDDVIGSVRFCSF